ncbi:hypothetical protein HYPSUDRAFT_56910 [Hypholoma sublateritium FD-334 SS-4]|uniref:Uncharacterized protein n=1 Tax=Hypholoma sublateritium (strain FD-334 SS-4) TaxID=945553 RepID=A0A0D2M6K3_HYPSF|nr:hypothetical protein HYPSUDRAFT_56910 [Hypholoma sublateritium FD-334 SS-4]
MPVPGQAEPSGGRLRRQSGGGDAQLVDTAGKTESLSAGVQAGGRFPRKAKEIVAPAPSALSGAGRGSETSAVRRAREVALTAPDESISEPNAAQNHVHKSKLAKGKQRTGNDTFNSPPHTTRASGGTVPSSGNNPKGKKRAREDEDDRMSPRGKTSMSMVGRQRKANEATRRAQAAGAVGQTRVRIYAQTAVAAPRRHPAGHARSMNDDMRRRQHRYGGRQAARAPSVSMRSVGSHPRTATSLRVCSDAPQGAPKGQSLRAAGGATPDGTAAASHVQDTDSGVRSERAGVRWTGAARKLKIILSRL